MTVLSEVESILRQEECEDEIFHVDCNHCGVSIDPHEDPVYCWNFMINELHQQIFVCGGCDAEHRINYKTRCLVKNWRS